MVGGDSRQQLTTTTDRFTTMANPANPQYCTGISIAVVPGSTSVTPLFSVPTAARSFLVTALPDNTGTDGITFDFLATPINQGGLSFGPLSDGRYYNMAQINVQAENTTDGVLVSYIV